MPAASAADDIAAPFLAFRGASLRYRAGKRQRRKVAETASDLLPRGSILATRKNASGVDSAIFCDWASHFIAEIGGLLAHGRKILLTCGGYGGHARCKALEKLGEAGVAACALPAHASADAQPLENAAFSSLKAALSKAIQDCAKIHESAALNALDFCAML